jgi:hypothetical protein
MIDYKIPRFPLQHFRRPLFGLVHGLSQFLEKRQNKTVLHCISGVFICILIGKAAILNYICIEKRISYAEKKD